MFSIFITFRLADTHILPSLSSVIAEIKLSLRILFSTSNDFLVLGLYMLIPLCVPSHTNPLLSLKI